MANPGAPMVESVHWPSVFPSVAVCSEDDLNIDLDLDLDSNVVDLDEKAEVEQCDSSQVDRPPWDWLPPELLVKIFRHLGDRDKENVESTCQAWSEACQDPTLWHTQTFSFTGDNCLQLVHQACRTIQRKGYLLRTMTLKVGLPSLPQAWLMSQCVNQLLEYIANQPAARYIHSLTVIRLDFFRHWKFFTLSKRNILLALSKFLLGQSYLADVNFTHCGLSADDGMRVLRAIAMSPSRQTVKHLYLHGFFHSKYQATLGSRFSHLLTSSFRALSHLVVDARHVNSSLLLSLLTRLPCGRCPLRHLALHFESSPPREDITEKVWAQVRQHNPDLDVTFVFEGRLPLQWTRIVLAPSVPLTEVIVCWPRAYRQTSTTQEQLAALLDRVARLYSGILERFRLKSSIRASTEIELALVRLANDCRRLVEFKASVKLTPCVLQEIRSNLLSRSQPIQFQLWRKKHVHDVRHQIRNRNRGTH